MKKSAKIIAAIAATAIAGSAAVGGTLAWLTSNAHVTNTFSVGDITLTIDEPSAKQEANTGNSYMTSTADGVKYKLLPGNEMTKDPTITVEKGNEACYVFAVVENQFASLTDKENAPLVDVYYNTSSTKYNNTKWELVKTDGDKTVYVYKADGSYILPAVEDKQENSDTVLDVIFNKIELSENYDKDLDQTKLTDKEVVVTGYAIQKEGFDNYTEAYKALQGDLPTASLPNIQ